jgi:hypothetical protein
MDSEAVQQVKKELDARTYKRMELEPGMFTKVFTGENALADMLAFNEYNHNLIAFFGSKHSTWGPITGEEHEAYEAFYKETWCEY